MKTFNRVYRDHWHSTIHHGGGEENTSEGAAKPDYEYLKHYTPARTWLGEFVLAAPAGLRMCDTHWTAQLLAHGTTTCGPHAV